MTPLMMPNAGPTAPRASMRTRTDCRLCGADRLRCVLTLEPTPPANELVSAADRGIAQERFPLRVHLCEACGHVQLPDVVDPERLFRNYAYVSGTSPVFVDHLRRYASAVAAEFGLRRGARVIEIGSNDGTLLRCFQAQGMQVLGVDPARAIAERATASGIPTRPEFFDVALARRLREDGWRADLVAANNVFAHADDLHDIVEGVAELLQPNGVFVFEVSYLLDVVDKLLFDTIYHEHLSYHSVGPLRGLFARHGMELVDAIRVETQGGSLRAVAAKRGAHPTRPRVQELIALEAARRLDRLETYQDMSVRIDHLKRALGDLLRRLKADGKRIVGFGAPAKATTLMFQFGIGPDVIDALIDENPLKQGWYSPGFHLPIVPASYLYDAATRPDYAVVLAWNFAEPIMRAHAAFIEQGGRFIVPLPALTVRPA